MLWLLLILSARPTASLDFEGPPACPDRAALVDRVAARLGYDPFGAAPSVSIHAQVRAGGPGWIGALQIKDGGQAPGEWEKSVRKAACGELIEEMALAISLALDPLGTHRLEAPPPPIPPPEPPLPPPPPPPVRTATVAAVPEAPLQRQTRFGLEVGLSMGLVPAPTAGFGAGLTHQIERFEIDLHARITAPGAVNIGPRADASAFAIYGAVYPCYDFPVGMGFWSVCAAFGAGAFYAQGEELQPSRTATKPLVLAGARVGYRLPLARSGVSIELGAEVDAAITRTILLVGGEEIWRQPALSGFLSLGFCYER